MLEKLQFDALNHAFVQFSICSEALCDFAMHWRQERKTGEKVWIKILHSSTIDIFSRSD